jgi:polyisoprenoid-binding protein YceI
MSSSTKVVSTLLGLAFAAGVSAAPVTYEIDPAHTYPSFEADHSGGVSMWRGKFNSSAGKITLDKEAGAGTVEVTIDMKSIDFGHQGLNDHAQTPDIFDTAQFPTATYSGRLAGFRNGSPTTVEGNLTMHGVTKPVTLTINSFKCAPHRSGREVCGADASATINREDWGVAFGKNFGFDMKVTLRISVEASAAS